LEWMGRTAYHTGQRGVFEVNAVFPRLLVHPFRSLVDVERLKRQIIRQFGFLLMFLEFEG
jgi:hypothetical protein